MLDAERRKRGGKSHFKSNKKIKRKVHVSEKAFFSFYVSRAADERKNFCHFNQFSSFTMQKESPFNIFSLEFTSNVMHFHSAKFMQSDSNDKF